ncbi:TY-Chap domain-containing protein [Serinicoccus profundi]|uniref:TY-Chap domain-containing protein n=1 Tax=Serinicoccus profundi TaxID=1078471 RepID=UPI00114799D5|nr:hypothetical protein [Serinicoccus profundi]
MSVQQARLGWEEFATQLARAIRELPDRGFLVVQDGATPAHVQFAADDDAVAAECTSNSNQQLTHPADDNGEQRLAESGWTLYSHARPNWTFRLDFSAITARFDQLAHSCIVALRDVYVTSAPEQLSYTAWREPEVMHSGRTYTDEEISSLDAGQNPLPVESLTIPMTRG